MSVPDTQARLATSGREVIVRAGAGQLACLAALDDANAIKSNAINHLLTDLPMMGRFVACSLEPVEDTDERPTFLNCALALNGNIPFGCDKLQLTDRSLMHTRTHDRFDVWVASKSRESRKISPPPTYKLLASHDART